MAFVGYLKMFAFKARSISEPIADPIAAGTTIPAGAVIFVMQSNASIPSNWSFINISQSDGTPSLIRSSTTVSNAGQIFARNITQLITTSTAGDHIGNDVYFTVWWNPKYSDANHPLTYLQRGNGGGHTHTISGLNGINAIGGKYPLSAVVGMYKLTSSTTVLPNNAICFANSVQNLDFSPLDNFHSDYDGYTLISSSSTWVSANISANNGIYGQSPNFDIPSSDLYYSVSGSHNHVSSYPDTGSSNFGGQVTYTQTYASLTSSGNQLHNHAGANGVSVGCRTAQQYLHPYKAIRNTSVYKGMILGWVGTNASSLPKGWYICNGQIVNGYQTPALNTGDAVSLTNTPSSLGDRSGVSDGAIVAYYIGGTSTHSHGTSNYNTYSTLTWQNAGNYHGNYDWNHRHDGAAEITYKQGYYTLNFIIYLG